MRLSGAVHRAVISRQICSIPFRSCTTNARLGCSPDGHLAGLLPFLSGVCGPAQFRCSRQIHGGKWRTFLSDPRLFGSAAFASLLPNGVRDTPSDGADLRCAEHPAEICVLSVPARDRSRRVICGLGKIHSDGVSWECPSARNCIDIRLTFQIEIAGTEQEGSCASGAAYKTCVCHS